MLIFIQVGTCAMKPFDQGGVVDSKLNLYGVKKLKVADLSIAPSNVHPVSRPKLCVPSIYLDLLPEYLLGCHRDWREGRAHHRRGTRRVCLILEFMDEFQVTR